MLTKLASLLLLAGAATAQPQSASSVCVYNDAAFVLKWHLLNTDTGKSTPETGTYAVWNTKCLPILNTTAGASLKPVVKAVLGREVSASEVVLYDAVNAAAVTYVCKGTTLDFDCKQGPAPATAANVTKAVGEFVLGFAIGLGEQLGFADCIKDLQKVFTDITNIINFFQLGINHKTVDNVVRAFELMGALLKDFVVAALTCIKDGKALAGKIQQVATALSGDVLSIIKVVVEEGIKIWTSRKEITADAKATTVDWRAGDYEGSGRAVGDIVGVILSGL